MALHGARVQARRELTKIFRKLRSRVAGETDSEINDENLRGDQTFPSFVAGAVYTVLSAYLRAIEIKSATALRGIMVSIYHA